MPSGKQIKPLIDRRCAELGITLKQVGVLSGRTPTWLYQVLASKNVQAKTIHRLAQSLQVEPGYFFENLPQKNYVSRKGRK